MLENKGSIASGLSSGERKHLRGELSKTRATRDALRIRAKEKEVANIRLQAIAEQKTRRRRFQDRFIELACCVDGNDYSDQKILEERAELHWLAIKLATNYRLRDGWILRYRGFLERYIDDEGRRYLNEKLAFDSQGQPLTRLEVIRDRVVSPSERSQYKRFAVWTEFISKKTNPFLR